MQAEELTIEQLSETLDILWVLVSAALVLLMQAGFMCLESGLVRAKNSINVAIKNAFDLFVGIASYCAVGFSFMFGISCFGFVGGLRESLFPESPAEIAFLVFQSLFCGTAATIVSGAIAERARFWAYAVIVVFSTTIVFPIYGHWAWATGAGGGQGGWLAELGFVDFAGGTVVHSVGGWIALAALFVIGPRIDRFQPGGQPRKIQPSSLTLAFLGTLVLVFGWLGFNCGSTLSATPEIAPIALNTLLGATIGGLAAASLSAMKDRHNRPEPTAIINGILGGLVAVTPGCASLGTWACICIAAIAGFTVNLVDHCLLVRGKIDDAVSAVAVHGYCGVIGTLAVGGLASSATLSELGLSRGQFLGIQAIGVATAFLWAFPSAWLFFRWVNRILPLRVSEADERMGLNIAEHGAKSTLLELTTQMKRVADRGDAQQAVHVDVEIGDDHCEIADAFNTMVDNLIEQTNTTEAIVSGAAEAILAIHPSGEIVSINPAGIRLFDGTAEELLGKSFQELVLLPQAGSSREQLRAICEQEPIEVSAKSLTGRQLVVEVSGRVVQKAGGELIAVIVHDLSQRKHLEARLSHSSKLEAVGQLSAGIAHEINTPIQYIGENAKFLRRSFDQIERLLGLVKHLKSDSEASREQIDDSVAALREAAESTDLEFLCSEMPLAMEQSQQGAERVADIVRSMKTFSHPGAIEQVPVNLNESIQSTITVSRSEWKYVAELVTDFDDSLPEVTCLAGELNQVLLNMIVNAAHAIEQKSDAGDREMKGVALGAGNQLGTITISTQREDAWAIIKISDTGCGIPQHDADKIFEPFFTTKPAGKGTGQGLAIAHSVVVDRHSGAIRCQSEVGQGTTFTLRIPIAGKQAVDAVATTNATEADGNEQKVAPDSLSTFNATVPQTISEVLRGIETVN